LLTTLAGVALLSGNASLALVAAIALLPRLASLSLVTLLSNLSTLTSLSLLALRTSWAYRSWQSSWTWLTILSVLELREPGVDPLVERSDLGLEPRDDHARLRLHQLTMALPLSVLAIEYLREGYAPRIKQSFFAAVQLAQ
jgi:hypothetical protein